MGLHNCAASELFQNMSFCRYRQQLQLLTCSLMSARFLTCLGTPLPLLPLRLLGPLCSSSASSLQPEPSPAPVVAEGAADAGALRPGLRAAAAFLPPGAAGAEGATAGVAGATAAGTLTAAGVADASLRVPAERCAGLRALLLVRLVALSFFAGGGDVDPFAAGAAAAAAAHAPAGVTVSAAMTVGQPAAALSGSRLADATASMGAEACARGTLLSAGTGSCCRKLSAGAGLFLVLLLLRRKLRACRAAPAPARMLVLVCRGAAAHGSAQCVGVPPTLPAAPANAVLSARAAAPAAGAPAHAAPAAKPAEGRPGSARG